MTADQTEIRSPELDQARVRKAIDAITESNSRQTDKAFLALLLLQWPAMMALAYWVTPRTWLGAQSTVSPFLLLAVFLGGVVSLTPMVLVWLYPGRRLTRHVIAVGQMLTSSLLIHLTGGRIETHFHIFGSLAFLSFYLDWIVLVTASVVVAADHVFRGLYLPASIFGIDNLEPWRWMEHAGWVVFCDIFLIASCFQRLRKMRLVAEHQVRQEDLLHAAYTDTLTELPNRLAMEAELEARLARPDARFPVMYIDLDRFKSINDALGHTSGDRVLIEITQRLSGCMPAGSLLARIGGDEFVALLPQLCAPEQADMLAQDLLTCLLTPVRLGEQNFNIGASIGISLCPEHGRTPEELLGKADAAMYTVKAQGRRGFAVYADVMRKSTQNDELALKAGIANDEFTMHYQPLMDSRGQLESLEALMRWYSPSRGMVSPGEFIPLAESTGLILQLGKLAIEKVCRQIMVWTAAELPFGRVAINISPQQMETSDFLENLDAVLAAHPAAIGLLTFEITETACAAKPALIAERVAALRRRGIQVSLDDFGTGYSSLGRLQDLNFDVLKIDRTFVSRLGSSVAAVKVVEAIVNIAHLLRMTVVAEGVETDEQLQLLRGLECDVMQGYLFSKPLSPSDTRDFLDGYARKPIPIPPPQAPAASVFLPPAREQGRGAEAG